MIFNWNVDNNTTTKIRMIYTEFLSSSGYLFINKTNEYFKFDINVTFNIHGRKNIFEFEEDLKYCTSNYFFFPIYNFPIKIINFVDNVVTIDNDIIIPDEFYITKLEVDNNKIKYYNTTKISDNSFKIDDINYINDSEYIFPLVQCIITNSTIETSGKLLKKYKIGITSR